MRLIFLNMISQKIRKLLTIFRKFIYFPTMMNRHTQWRIKLTTPFSTNFLTTMTNYMKYKRTYT